MKYSFIQIFWISSSRSNHTGKKIIVGCSKDRLERSLYDIEWNHKTLPTLVIIPLGNKFRLRSIMRKWSLLLHIMLRQGISWYTLDTKEYLLPPPCLDDLEI